MSSRHIRRLQQDVLGPPVSDDESEEDELLQASSMKPNRKHKQPVPASFMLLDEDEDDDTEDDASEEAAKLIEPPVVTPPTVALTKKPKRGNNSNAGVDMVRPDDDDDALLEAALAAMASSKPAPAAPAPLAPFEPWKLSAMHLDVHNELSRLFGRQQLRAAQQAERRERQQQHGHAHGDAHARGYATTAARLRERGGGGGRAKLIRLRDEWPPLTGGLSMEVDHDAGATSIDEPTCTLGGGAPSAYYFAFGYSAAYRQHQRDLEDAVEVGDPRALQAIVQSAPYHAEANLRLGEYLALTGQLEAASEHAERALYACEQAVHPMCRLLDGSARLVYSHTANRPFYLALFRHMVSVGRRGCPRTALELGRLLLSLDPAADPFHALLHLDYYALRAAEAATATTTAAAAATSAGEAGAATPPDDPLQWLLQLAPTQLPAHSLALYPNYAYSMALAKKRLHERWLSRERRTDESDADQAASAAAEAAAEAAARAQLRRAMMLFPAALPLLVRAHAADGNATDTPRVSRLCESWADVHGPASSDVAYGATLRKLLRLYLNKSAALWAARGAHEWLMAEGERLCTELSAISNAEKKRSAPGGRGGEPSGKAPMADTLDSEQRETRRLWADLTAAREHEYGPGSGAHRIDEFASAEPTDFLPKPPDALPADQLADLDMAADLGANARQWVRVARQPGRGDAGGWAAGLRPEGRLVVPRAEWVELDQSASPFVRFLRSLLPWVVVTRNDRAR